MQLTEGFGKIPAQVFLLFYFSYVEVVREVVRADGVIGLLGRGLKTRLIANGIQVFTIIQH